VTAQACALETSKRFTACSRGALLDAPPAPAPVASGKQLPPRHTSPEPCDAQSLSLWQPAMQIAPVALGSPQPSPWLLRHSPWPPQSELLLQGTVHA
jgi:hypothetical protein